MTDPHVLEIQRRQLEPMSLTNSARYHAQCRSDIATLLALLIAQAAQVEQLKNENKALKKEHQDMTDPQLPRVMYPGGLTDREHAIIEAHRWQIAHGSDNLPVPTTAYTVIVGLLGLLPYEEVRAAIARAERAEG